MTRAIPAQGWFDNLRRERKLFALVAVFALLFGLLQPMAAARNAGFEDLLVLCSARGTPADAGSDPAPRCPLCVVGHVCALHAALGILPHPVLALHGPPARHKTPEGRVEQVFAGGGRAPPSIRAPPLSA